MRPPRGVTALVVVTLTLVGASLAGATAAARTPTCAGQAATIVGTNGADSLTGTRGRDVIVGLNGDDVIASRGGDDLVCGGYGADLLSGGAGTDQLHGGLDRLVGDVSGTYLLGDVLDGGPGQDLLVGGEDRRRADARRLPDTFSYAESPNGVVVDLSGTSGVATGEGTDTLRFGPHVGVRGSAYADTITGSVGRDHLHGGSGDDTLRGGPGDDRLLGEEVDEEVGDDLLVGGSGADLLGSYAGRDDVRGGTGDDFVEAYSDRPALVSGEAGDDYVAQNISPGRGSSSAGGGGEDTVVLYGALLAGNEPRTTFTIDLRAGTTSADLATPPTGTIGGFEEHRLVGNLQWRFHGSPAGDRVWAITGGPLLAWTYGGGDWIRGTARDDLFHGGTGTDRAVAGGGDDTCRSIELGGC